MPETVEESFGNDNGNGLIFILAQCCIFKIRQNRKAWLYTERVLKTNFDFKRHYCISINALSRSCLLSLNESSSCLVTECQKEVKSRFALVNKMTQIVIFTIQRNLCSKIQESDTVVSWILFFLGGGGWGGRQLGVRERDNSSPNYILTGLWNFRISGLRTGCNPLLKSILAGGLVKSCWIAVSWREKLNDAHIFKNALPWSRL